MSLILNNVPLHSTFRYAVPLSEETSASIFADSCIFLHNQADISSVSANSFVLVSFLDSFFSIENLVPILKGLAAHNVSGVCFCLSSGDDVACRALLSRAVPPFPIYLLVAACDPVTMLDDCLNLITGNYASWISDRFSQALACEIVNSGDIPSSCIHILNKFLGSKISLFFPPGHVFFPSLSKFQTDQETYEALVSALYNCADPVEISFSTSRGQACAFSVQSIQGILGYLVVSSGFSCFPKVDIPLIRKCIPYISAHLLELLENQQYMQMNKDLFFHDLLFSQVSRDPEVVFENARLLACPIEQRRAVFTLLLPPSISSDQVLSSQILSFCPFQIEYLTFPESTILTAIITGNIPDAPSKTEALFRPFLTMLNERLGENGQSAVMGIGRVCNYLHDITASYRESNVLLRIGHIITPQNDIYLFNYYLPFYLVDFFKETSIFLKLYSSTIDKLRHYNGNVGLELIHTLSVLSSHNFSVQKAADELFLHRNSLYDRLTTISRILEMDLKNQENQLLIYMLLILDSLLQHTPAAFQSPLFSFNSQDGLPSIFWQYKLPRSNQFYPEILEFESRLQAMSASSYTLENLLNLANLYIRHPIDLISAEDFSGFTKHNSLIFLNIACALERNSYRLYNAENFICFHMQQRIFIALKVIHRNHILAYLTVNYAQAEDVTALDLQILEHLSPYIVVWMMSQYGKAFSKSKSDFYRNLLIGHFKNDGEHLRKECFHFGISIQQQRFVTIISFTPENPSNESDILKEIEGFFSNYFHVFHCGDVSSSTTLLLEAADSSYIADIPALLSQLILQINAKFSSSFVRISVSQSCAYIDKISDAYKEASFAMTLGTLLYPNTQTYHYKDYIMYHMICTMWGNPVLERLYQATISPILSYDKKYRANLLYALDAYISAKFHINDASRRSGLHRNTLRKKIARIQEILGMDFSLTQNQLIIQIAIRLHRLQNAYPKTQQMLIWAMSNPNQ